jgi:hypothetical protein
LLGCRTISTSQIELTLSVGHAPDGTQDALALSWTDAQYNMSDWAVPDSSALMVCTGKPDGSSTAADCHKDASLWTSAVLRAASKRNVAATSTDTLLVDLSQLPSGAHVLALRYGWPLSRGADTCCPSKAVRSGIEPCVPASCPILTQKSHLPANPFYATLEGGRCKCMAPQKCDHDSELSA